MLAPTSAGRRRRRWSTMHLAAGYLAGVGSTPASCRTSTHAAGGRARSTRRARAADRDRCPPAAHASPRAARPARRAVRRRSAIRASSSPRCSTRWRDSTRARRQLRRLDHRRRSRRTGPASSRSATSYADRFAARRRAHGSRTCAARRPLPAPDAFAGRAPRPTTAATGRRLRRSRAALGRSKTCARFAATCTSTIALCVNVVLDRARASTWARAAPAGDGAAATPTSPDRSGPTVRRTLPEVFPDIAPGLLVGPRARSRSVSTTFNDTSRTSTTRTRGVPRDGQGRLRAARTSASTCCRSTPCRSCEAQGRRLPEPPEVHHCSRRCARSADRGAGRRLQGGGDRLPPARRLSGTGATRARSATSPTTTC